MDYENAELTYTLHIETTNRGVNTITAKAKQGVPVTLTKTGLENNTTYKYKVVVSNGETEATSLEGTARTYCKGEKSIDEAISAITGKTKTYMAE